jgi:hypothetical protein
VRDRDRLRGEHLQRLGWSFHRLWSTNWFSDPQGEMTKLQAAYDRAVADLDSEQAEEAAPPAPAPEPEREAEAEAEQRTETPSRALATRATSRGVRKMPSP